ncbi:MAG: dethiobiotin synthase [Peptococcaceae bacterium]|jgi:dethiobiotin synthetase|nr:dethiobiotin synthase [Peptococcaceae bacterium]
MSAGFFVTGTDTGVGKTALTGALACGLRRRGLDPGVMKPLASGATRGGSGLVSADALFLVRMAGVSDDLDLICPVCLELPLAPAVAAELAGQRVDLVRVEQAFLRLATRHNPMLVEGVGGLMVPLAPGVLVEDLALGLGLPLVVVARAGLGTVNHTLLTLARARARGLSVAGVILNGMSADPDPAESTNARVIAALGGVRILGVIPRGEGVDVEAGRAGNMAALVEEHLDWAAIMAVLEGDAV